MRNHYLPQFLLRGFADRDGLWQFDIHTGNFERRSVKNAGQRRHFYTAELETGLLQNIDGSAAAVLGKGILDREGRILLKEEGQCTLARWLGLFGMRTPETFESFRDRVAEAGKKPQMAVDILYKNRDDALRIMRESSPDGYQELVELLGAEAADEHCLALFSNRIHEGKADFSPPLATDGGLFLAAGNVFYCLR